MSVDKERIPDEENEDDEGELDSRERNAAANWMRADAENEDNQMDEEIQSAIEADYYGSQAALSLAKMAMERSTRGQGKISSHGCMVIQSLFDDDFTCIQFVMTLRGGRYHSRGLYDGIKGTEGSN